MRKDLQGHHTLDLMNFEICDMVNSCPEVSWSRDLEVGGSNKSKGRILYAGGTMDSLFKRLPLNSYVISHLRKHIAAGIGLAKGMKEND